MEKSGGISAVGYVVGLLLVLGTVVGLIEVLKPPRVRPLQAATNARAPFPRELQDGSGVRLEIARPPKRIVSQTLGTDEMLLDLCEPDRLAAVSVLASDPKYSNVAGRTELAGKPVAKGPESILQLQPDLIFVASYSRAELVDLLRAAGAPVFRFSNFDRIDDIKTNLRTLGYATGTDARAAHLVTQMETEIASIQARIPKIGTPPRVLSWSGSGYTVGAGTLFDDMVRTLGAVNVAAEQGVTGIQKISSEQVLNWQPDFLIVGAETGMVESTVQRILADPAIAATTAGQNRRIIVVDNRHFLAVSHYIVPALRTMAAGLYPDGMKNEKSG